MSSPSIGIIDGIFLHYSEYECTHAEPNGIGNALTGPPLSCDVHYGRDMRREQIPVAPLSQAQINYMCQQKSKGS